MYAVMILRHSLIPKSLLFAILINDRTGTICQVSLQKIGLDHIGILFRYEQGTIVAWKAASSRSVITQAMPIKWIAILMGETATWNHLCYIRFNMP